MKQWDAGDTPAQIPAQIACHIVEPIAGYATGEYHSCTRKFGVPAVSMELIISRDDLPDQQKVIAYIGDVKLSVHNWLSGLSNKMLLGPTPSPGWAQRGVTYLGRIIYILRHGTYHLGMLRAELDSRGVKYGGVFK